MNINQLPLNKSIIAFDIGVESPRKAVYESNEDTEKELLDL